ncbi:Dna2/Cas4 domain-containing protein [Methanobrevibacter sp. TMH8]|uniref:CRISPR-associated protein Cas4 n=1 Tax=Methanobrevibacter sp. TMH8 TaxID=2848611 RepID=UPI001CC95678|nr:Dna2/Cas4 domain-containing protein [Methanobrevibacter sp. TMH8]MBZ9571403.1 Dna2/Cas4 domain-containing protein [Methanobrevibacter sp. TMH8]
MISTSSIRTYMFCPIKLYLQKSLDETINNDILLHKTIKELRIDLHDLFQRNLRRIKKEMTLIEIEENLSKNIEEYIQNSINILKNSEKKVLELNNIENKENVDLFEKEVEKEIEEIDKIEEMKIEIEAEVYFNIKILALKAQKSMELNDKDGSQIAELFFPTSMHSYLMRDNQLEIVGTCDKIEIIDGKYYPISLRSSKPPLKGTWDGDSIELVAAALLIEQEFDTEVFVGFVEYLKIGDRRPVIMDANLRKGLFKVLKEIDDILNEKIVPEVNKNMEKCLNCDYNTVCNQEII